MEINDLYKLMSITNNDVINKAFLIMNNRINNYSKILCSISGGSDSDIIIDMIHNIKPLSDIHYVYFDTGLEYRATKEHIEYLKNKYNINIEVIKPKVPIPLSCMKYGQPFLSKHVSEMMERLQNHGFKWEDDTLENLEYELEVCSKYEPLLYKAICKVFKNSYEYTRKYNEFKKSFGGC